MKNSADRINLSAEALFNNTSNNAENVIMIPFDQLHRPAKTPFKPYSEADMDKLAGSICRIGQLNPIIVRPREKGGYEIVDGMQRVEGCDIAQKDGVKCLVYNLNYEEAVFAMVDLNLEQRENILISERAWAYRMKLDALNMQGQRNDLTSDGFRPKLAIEQLAEETGLKTTAIKTFIRLTYLNEALLDLVDSGQLKQSPAYSLSFLKGNEQNWLIYLLEEKGFSPSVVQAEEIKAASEKGTLTEDNMLEILAREKPTETKVILKPKTIQSYFPPKATPRQIEQYIIKLLEERKEQIAKDPLFAGENSKPEKSNIVPLAR